MERFFLLKKKKDDLVEIQLSKSLEEDIAQGTQIRIQGTPTIFIYKMIKNLSPGESVTHKSSIAQFSTYPLYSAKAISREVTYVKPLILSYSFENTNENSIEITDWTLSY